VITEVLVVIVLIIINGLFAMAEISLVSSRKIRLAKMAEEGNKNAAIALKLANEPEKLLSTVQIGITAVSIIAGAYSGTTLADDLGSVFVKWHVAAPYAHFFGLILIVSITTFLTLIIGELVPKAIGIKNPEQTAVLMVPVIRVTAYLAKPLIALLSITTRVILNILNISNHEEPPVTEDELKELIEQSEEHGVLEKEESEMMQSVIRVGDRNVSSLMTHRSEIVWLDLFETNSEILKRIEETGHSYFPVAENDLDHVRGIVTVKEIFMQIANKKEIDLSKIIKQTLFVPETMHALELVETFKKNKTHFGLVVNEYGLLEGIVTLHDLIEAIVGDLPAENEHDIEMAIQRNDGSWLMDGMIPNDEWMTKLEIEELNDDDTGNNNTLGGFVTHQLGRIPRTADEFQFQHFHFEVIDMDGARVDKVLIKKLELPKEPVTEE
jgi:putative hemolysin